MCCKRLFSLSLSLSLSLNSVPLMVDVGIIDPATKRKVPNGERGEVCIKGAMIMKVSVCVCVWVADLNACF